METLPEPEPKSELGQLIIIALIKVTEIPKPKLPIYEGNPETTEGGW